MAPFVQFIVNLGAWAQQHPTLVLFTCVTIVLLLGGLKCAQHTAFFSRRPRL